MCFISGRTSTLKKLSAFWGPLSAGYFLTAKVLADFVPPELQVEYEDVLLVSKMLWIAHMQVKDNKVDESMKQREKNPDNQI